MSQVAIIAKFTANDGMRYQLIEALQAALETAQEEPGTLRYILHEDTTDANVLWFYELYADREAMVAHGSSAGMKALGPVVAPFAAGRPEITFVKPIAGKGL